MKRYLCLILILGCVLSGCSWMDGSYYSVKAHEQQQFGVQTGVKSASNYLELRTVLEELVEAGQESGVINVTEYDQEKLEKGVDTAANHIRGWFPLGVYAVDDISCEIGTSGGQPAVSVSISYIHGRSEIRQIQEVTTMEEAEAAIAEALAACSDGIVLLIDEYADRDFVQMVEDYAQDNPDVVMETPEVAVGLYPDAGWSRVVELKFTYQTSRDVLRQMQTQVQRTFKSASLYINSDSSDARQYSQLYTFLMERSDYQIETSITPAYSLLSYGVGDSKAFACVYAAMCRQAGLECRVVSGTRDGEAWYWNQVLDGGRYFHVDLLRSYETGYFQKLTDADMQGYVWNYGAYPSTPVEEEEKNSE